MKDGVPNSIVIREALPKDAEQIVDLFNITYNYGYGVDECRDIGKVRKILEDKRDRWQVALDGDRIIASTVGMPNKWNRTYEACRGATHPDYRRLGLATELYKATLEACYPQGDCDLTFAFLRSFGVYQMVYKTGYNFLLTGYDGGMHITDKKRELHLSGLTKNPYKSVARIVHAESGLAKNSFIKDSILSRADFDDSFGKYPDISIVGPTSKTYRTINGLDLHYLYMPSSKSVQILDISGDRESDFIEISKTVEKFLCKPSFTVEHSFIYVLSDKENIIKDLYNIGFEITAYLPAWYYQDGMRYDCVMMVKRMYTEEPVMHQTDGIIGNFKTNFSRLAGELRVV